MKNSGKKLEIFAEVKDFETMVTDTRIFAMHVSTVEIIAFLTLIIGRFLVQLSDKEADMFLYALTATVKEKRKRGENHDAEGIQQDL